jgi:MYXO-CTERM domain-containing protein
MTPVMRSRGPLAGRAAFAAAAVLGFSPPAAAEPRAAAAPTGLTVDGVPARRALVEVPVAPHAEPAPASRTIFLNRCAGGCRIHAGVNNASTDTSTIPQVTRDTPGPTFQLSEFVGGSNLLPGAAANQDWNAVVACMTDVYSPYGVMVTDKRPTTGTYHEAVIAGNPQEVGLSMDILGVAPLASDCSAIDNVMSFSFANRHPPNDRVFNICWTAAQESAHAFGLDHEYSFIDRSSACKDPMTYRNDCGGEKFFRNEPANCGETAVRACKCGATQNSHAKLLRVFGPGTPSTTPPTVALESLTAGGMLGSSIDATAGAQRGVAHVDLYVNGFQWATVPGAAFLRSGQPDPFTYTLDVPHTLPDSIVDLKVIAYDDLEVAAESDTVTMVKGAACTTAASCAVGQKCTAGKCLWDSPVGEIGDACSYSQFCKSLLCSGTSGDQVCTTACTLGASDTCPDGFACAASSDLTGVCLATATAAGCCSAGGASGPWGSLGLGAVALGALARRRRRS